MPTILRVGPYRFFFYSNENSEPGHIHVERDDCVCKFWVDSVALADNIGFSAKQLREIDQIVKENQGLFKTAYNKYHG